jgi:hypothetical protein
MNTLLFAALLGLAPAAAPLTTNEAVVDRGNVKAGAPLAHTFHLRNQSEMPVVIGEVAAGCGCLRPKLSRKNIPPGASAELAFEINTLSQAEGPNSWTATIHYKYGNETGELGIQLKANLRREITIEPVALGLTIDKEASHTFTLTDRRAKPLTIAAARCSSKDIKTQLTAIGVNSKGERIQQVHITILDSFPPGHSTEILQIVTDDEEYRELNVRISVTRRIPGQVAASPDQIDLRLTSGQATASGLVRLRDPDDRPVVVDRIETDHAAVRFKWVPGPGSMATVRLGVETDGKAVSGRGSVTVYLKEPKGQVLVIPVTWQR